MCSRIISIITGREYNGTNIKQYNQLVISKLSGSGKLRDWQVKVLITTSVVLRNIKSAAKNSPKVLCKNSYELSN